MKQNEIRNKMYNYRKIDWKDVFPSKNVISAELGFYQSKINISDKNGKEYIDPEFGYPEPLSKINYIVLNGKWEIDSFIEDGKHKLKVVDDKSGQSIEFAFASISDKISFVNEMYSNKPVKQVNTGINVEYMINHKIIKKPVVWLPVLTAISILITYFISKKNK